MYNATPQTSSTGFMLQQASTSDTNLLLKNQAPTSNSNLFLRTGSTPIQHKVPKTKQASTNRAGPKLPLSKHPSDHQEKRFPVTSGINSKSCTNVNPVANELTSRPQLQIQHKGHRVIPNNHHKETSVEQVPKSSFSKNLNKKNRIQSTTCHTSE